MGKVVYNRFRGLRTAKGSVEPFFKLYNWLMSRTDEFEDDFVWKLICYKAQNLEASLDLGLVLIGPQGVGKTMFATIVSEMFVPYRKILTSRALDANFNKWVETSLCVVVDEAKGKRLKDSMDMLNSLITHRRQTVNEKYRAKRDCDTYAFYIFTSNETNAGAFAHDDRRMIVWEMPDKHPQGDAFYEDIYKWWREQDGPAKLLHCAQNYDLEGWSPPKHAPTTRHMNFVEKRDG